MNTFTYVISINMKVRQCDCLMKIALILFCMICGQSYFTCGVSIGYEFNINRNTLLSFRMHLLISE